MRTLAVRGRLAAVSDAAAILVFAILGLISHRASVGAFAHDALPLLFGWFAVALAVQLYARPSVKRFLMTWSVGITAGVLLRALILGRHLNGKQAAFLATSLVFTVLFVLALRAATALWRCRR
jgi:hypothetical protein